MSGGASQQQQRTYRMSGDGTSEEEGQEATRLLHNLFWKPPKSSLLKNIILWIYYIYIISQLIYIY